MAVAKASATEFLTSRSNRRITQSSAIKTHAMTRLSFKTSIVKLLK